MTVTSIDIDQNDLALAKEVAGTTTARETVDLALRTLIAVRRQPAVVERLIGRSFEPDQIDAPTIPPHPIPPPPTSPSPTTSSPTTSSDEPGA